MGIPPGSSPARERDGETKKNHEHSYRRENMQRPKSPSDLVIPLPNDTYVVNTNGHNGGSDTIKPFQDLAHPTGRFHSLEEALNTAKALFESKPKRFGVDIQSSANGHEH